MSGNAGNGVGGMSGSVGASGGCGVDGMSGIFGNGVATPTERLEVLKSLHNEGIKTFASFEPVIEPDESIELIKQTLKDNSVDLYKIGKLNNYRGLDKGIDWRGFTTECLNMLRGANKQIYIKRSLQPFVTDLTWSEEICADKYIVV